MKTFKTITIIVLAIISFGAFAQQPVISGTWTLKEKTGISGPQYANALPEKYTVTVTKDSLITTGTFGSTVSRVANSLYSETVIKSGDRTVTSKIKWSADRKALTITSALSVPGDDKKIDLTRIKTLRIENGELHVDLKSEENNPANQSWETEAIYVRQ